MARRFALVRAESEEGESMNHWEFSGRVEVCERKPLKSGKTLYTVVMQRDGHDVCVATYWGETAPACGQVIECMGTVGAHQWQGKWYPELRMLEWRPAGNKDALSGGPEPMPEWVGKEPPPLTAKDEEEGIPF